LVLRNILFTAGGNEWEDDKIIATKCYLDPTELNAEIALYHQKMSLPEDDKSSE